MSIIIPWWCIPFLIVGFGFLIVRACAETLGVAVLVLLFSITAAIAFTAGKLLS